MIGEPVKFAVRASQIVRRQPEAPFQQEQDAMSVQGNRDASVAIFVIVVEKPIQLLSDPFGQIGAKFSVGQARLGAIAKRIQFFWLWPESDCKLF